MVFSRYVEVGRIVLINYGPSTGSLAAIVDIVDGNKCLIDGPCTGVERQVISFKRVSLTDLTVPIGRGARAASIKKAWSSSDINSLWSSSAWGKRLSDKKKRRNLDDFGRFKVMVARKQKAGIVKRKIKGIKA